MASRLPPPAPPGQGRAARAKIQSRFRPSRGPPAAGGRPGRPRPPRSGSWRPVPVGDREDPGAGVQLGAVGVHVGVAQLVQREVRDQGGPEAGPHQGEHGGELQAHVGDVGAPTADQPVQRRPGRAARRPGHPGPRQHLGRAARRPRHRDDDAVRVAQQRPHDDPRRAALRRRPRRARGRRRRGGRRPGRGWRRGRSPRPRGPGPPGGRPAGRPPRGRRAGGPRWGRRRRRPSRTRRRAGSDTVCSAAASAAARSSACALTASPTAVRARLRPPPSRDRSRRASPVSASSRARCWLTADGVRPSRSAAASTPPWRWTARRTSSRRGSRVMAASWRARPPIVLGALVVVSRPAPRSRSGTRAPWPGCGRGPLAWPGRCRRGCGRLDREAEPVRDLRVACARSTSRAARPARARSAGRGGRGCRRRRASTAAWRASSRAGRGGQDQRLAGGDHPDGARQVARGVALDDEA